MRKVMGGLVFDTDTATKIAERAEETLYRTKNGRCFLHAGGDIVYITMDAAKGWLGSHEIAVGLLGNMYIR